MLENLEGFGLEDSGIVSDLPLRVVSGPEGRREDVFIALLDVCILVILYSYVYYFAI